MIPPSAILQGLADMAEPKTVEVIPGVDHFWQRHEEKAADAVAGFFTEIFTSKARPLDFKAFKTIDEGKYTLKRCLHFWLFTLF